jgi:hypothetical protein
LDQPRAGKDGGAIIPRSAVTTRRSVFRLTPLPTRTRLPIGQDDLNRVACKVVIDRRRCGSRLQWRVGQAHRHEVPRLHRG